MPINAHPEYLAAEKEYLAAQNPEEKLRALEKMISLAPGHKGAEKLRAELKTRYKKLKEKLEKGNRARRQGSGKTGIKKEELQAVIVGFTNSGKSSLLKDLTNAEPEISTGFEKFKTKYPLVGVMDHSGTRVQIIEIPAIGSEYYDRGIANSADVVVILVTEINQINEAKKELEKARGKKIIAFNKIDLLNEEERRKISASLQSKKYDFALISAKNKENLEELRNKIFGSFRKIRVYTKEPRKEASMQRPLILEPDSTAKDAAEKILKGLSSKIKEIKIWGPSSKFSGQKVGLKHRLKDKDIVEFKTK